ncbi:MAG: hypothetical protein Q4C64_00070 [Erysipelotrichia bacterium]|nr:hypothetical protein [Erysipelotrichia bacterium]
MKKKILISIIVFLVVTIILMLILTNSYIDDNIQLTQVLYGSISPEYNFLASAQGEKHYQFFSGTIKELYYLPPDKINKDDIVLDYYDAYGKVKNLKANYNGFLLEF